MEGPRAPLESEYQEVVQFLSRHLRPEQTWSIADEYPLAIHPSNLSNIRIIKSGEKLLSGAVTKTLFIRNIMGVFRVAAIGSVVTDPTYRNQGLSRSVLSSALELAGEQQADFAILWSELHDFYRKLGFELAGSEVSLCLENEIQVPSSIPALRIVESAKVAAESIARLYAQHTCGTIRTAEDIRKYLHVPNSRVYTAWDGQNILQAYAIEGKGADLKLHIHEWGGKTSALLPLLAHVRKVLAAPVTIMCPAHSQNLVRQLTEAGATKFEGVLGMIKIVSPENLLSKIRRHARHIGIQDLILEYENGIFYFGTQSQIYKTDSEQDMVRLLFGPQKPSQIHSFDDKTNQILESVLPIPMWIWGWDSV